MYFFLFLFTACTLEKDSMYQCTWIYPYLFLKERDKPNWFSQKYIERIICVLFLYLSPLFRQYHCHNSFFLTFSAIRLSQNFFSYFDNTIATINLSQIFFPLFRQYHYHNFSSFFFFPQFQQWHCRNWEIIFSHIFGNPIAVFSPFYFYFLFLILLYFFFSHIYGNAIAVILFSFLSYNFSNGTAEIEEKLNNFPLFRQ